MTTLIILYIIGFIITYILCKHYRGKDEKNNTWQDVGITLVFSICSFIGLVVILIIAIMYTDFTSKPPKYL